MLNIVNIIRLSLFPQKFMLCKFNYFFILSNSNLFTDVIIKYFSKTDLNK